VTPETSSPSKPTPKPQQVHASRADDEARSAEESARPERKVPISVRGFSSWYSRFKALHEIDLQIPARQVTALIGPSGCGKSTFLRWINRMNDLIPGARAEGSLTLDGQDLLEKRLDVPSFLFEDIHGVGHGHTLFPEQVEVPLILRGPGVPKGRVEEQVRLIDVAPTLLSLAGISDPEFDPRGDPLVAPWREGELADRLAVSETRTQWNRQRSIQSPDFQYVRIDGERELLFDQRDGGFEEITGEGPAVLERLRGKLEARTADPPAESEQVDDGLEQDRLEPRLCRELVHLGYIESGSCD